MHDNAASASARWTVLVNDEQQHGLFPTDLPAPAGWHPTGFTGTEDECEAYTDEHWTDLRPLSLRR
ncbi:MbtH family protein [Kitasatospora sp. NPDC058218]|uniref:MbtH family protein n=1 Tax=Kitasatospora sp. NPDC058218 TaxID=3346385 RepID=UPI0036D9CF6E